MKDKLKPAKLMTAPAPLKIKEGRVTITLEDKAGNREVIADHNMPTDALNEYLASCGWLNRDNAPQDNLVQELLGGILLLNDTLDEDEDVIQVPSGVDMIANGAVGTTNTGTPYELGSCSAIETETGWQSDGSYLQTYRWDENHGNCPSGQSIKAVALTAKQIGYAGIGNQSGAYLAGSRLDTLYPGTPTPYVLGAMSVNYLTAHVSVKNSEAYRLDLTDIANGNIEINKYRIPTGKVNLKGTSTSPTLLETQTITTEDSTLIAILTSIKNQQDPYRYNYYDAYDHFWIWNHATGSNVVWGTDYDQYLWDIDVVSGTITKYTVLNTSGDTLHGIYAPVFIGDTVVFINGYFYNAYNRGEDTTKIYQFAISNGAAGAITSIANTLGWSGNTSPIIYRYGVSGDKAIIARTGTYWIIYDKAGAVYPINAGASSVSLNVMQATDCALVNYHNSYYVGSQYTSCAIQLYRAMNYIATIFNCETAYTKDATKTMTVVYRLTFEEEDENE